MKAVKIFGKFYPAEAREATRQVFTLSAGKEVEVSAGRHGRSNGLLQIAARYKGYKTLAALRAACGDLERGLDLDIK